MQCLLFKAAALRNYTARFVFKIPV